MTIGIYLPRVARWLSAESNGRIGHRTWRYSWEAFKVLQHPDGKNLMLKEHMADIWDFYLLEQQIIMELDLFANLLIIQLFLVLKERALLQVDGPGNVYSLKKQGNYWGIYNPFHKRYMNGCTNQKALGMPWMRGCEQFQIYEIKKWTKYFD